MNSYTHYQPLGIDRLCVEMVEGETGHAGTELVEPAHLLGEDGTERLVRAGAEARARAETLR